MSSVARTTIAKARFFLDRADEAGPNGREAFCNYLEASIVFARSVTLHLQKECANRPGFAEWYAAQQKLLGQNRLARFLLEQRNYVLKEGPVATRRVLEMTMTESIHLSDSATVTVIRGAPWYRRSPRVLWDDATYPLRAKLHSLRAKRVHAKARRQTQSSSVTRDAIFFTDGECNSEPATVLVRRLLDELDVVVSEAELKFLSLGSSGGYEDADNRAGTLSSVQPHVQPKQADHNNGDD
jgi:hypothetical protein